MKGKLYHISTILQTLCQAWPLPSWYSTPKCQSNECMEYLWKVY